MQTHSFGRLPPVSILTLGGGGLGMLWGQTTRNECIATVHDAVAAGITLLDLAPSYGDGKAEEVVGEAFGGRLPAGVRVTTKCGLGGPPADQVEGVLRRSLEASLKRLRLDRVDVFFLHSNLVPEGHAMLSRPDAARFTPVPLFERSVRPVFERLVQEGLIGAWGITGIGHPDGVIQVLGQSPGPAVVQVISNLLDSPGGLKHYPEPARPRDIMAAARASGVAVMGIRAVQAGALTSVVDRELPADHPEMVDYARAARFRALCAEMGEDPAVVAHRYALAMDVDTLVLGVKNRAELAQCVAAADMGALGAEVVRRVDTLFVASIASDTAPE